MANGLNPDIWKSWERTGKSEFIKVCRALIKEESRTPLLSKTGKITGIARAVYDLVTHGIKGSLRKEAVNAMIHELAGLHNDLPSIILDVLNVLDAETLCSDSSSDERTNFCQITKETEKYLSDQLLKERLEIDTLQDVGILSKNRSFYTKFIKIKTKLYYKQRKFNLYREESEGYAKLIVELNQEISDTVTPKTILEIIKSLIGCFNLDPNRVLDIILESFECRPEQVNFFIPLIRSYMTDAKIICEVLGFKFSNESCNNTPKSLYKVTALMLQHGIIALDDIYCWLTPDDKLLNREFERELAEAREYVRKLNIISLNKDKEPEPVEEKDNPLENYERNQKFNLCQTLVEIGDWHNIQLLCKKFPDNFVIDQQPIALELCKLVHAIIDPVYRSKCKIPLKTKIRAVPKIAYELAPKPAETFIELKNHAIPMIIFLGPSLHYDPVLMNKIIRICEATLLEMGVDSSKKPPDTDNLYHDIISIMDAAILPSLSFKNCNCCIAEEIWNVLKLYPYHYRYSLYGRWKNDTYQQYAKLMRRKGDTQKEIKNLVKRISKENIKPIGRSIGKLTHCSPGFFLDYVLLQIQIYDNLIPPVVDSLKYLTSLSYDMLGYCLIEALTNPDKDRFKHDGTSISLWLQSLASFCGAIFKKYNIELCGLLQYVGNQLKAQKSTDLLILKEIVHKMACIDASEELTEDQLEAMAGGELLKGEAASFSQIRNTKKSSLRLKEAMNEHDLAVALCMLIAQQKYCVVYRETEYTHLKLVGKLYDQCQDTLVQFGTFLGSTYSVDEYVTRLPSIHSMLQDYHIHSDVAFFLARPMFAHAINLKYDQLRKADPNVKKLSTIVKQAKYSEAANFVMAPIVTSVRPLHPSKVWDDISPQFLVTFWSLTMADLHVPVESYTREITRLKQLSLEALDSPDSVNKTKKDQDRHVALTEKLQDERKKQQEHVEKVLYRLKQEKDSWFLSRSSKSAKNETITQFLQLCLFPRCIFTAVDAIYCARFVHTIHSLKTANFSTLLCYDRIFCDITYSVTSCTENEAHRYGRFLCAMLATVMKWHSDKAMFEKECANYPGFVTKFRVSNQFCEANDHVGYENYRHVCHKWHYKITKAMVVCLDSKDYVQIRNALIILVNILPHFPVLAKLSQIIERKIEKVKEEEKDQRQDLYAMALSYGGQLKGKSNSMIRESEFHHVGDKVYKNDIGADGPSKNGEVKPEKEKQKDSTRDRDKKSARNSLNDSKGDREKRDVQKERTPNEKDRVIKKEERTSRVVDDERERDRERGKRKERKEEQVKEERSYKEERYTEPLSPVHPSPVGRYGNSGHWPIDVVHDDRELSSVSSNGSNLHRRSQEPPEADRDVKRRKLEGSSKNHKDGRDGPVSASSGHLSSSDKTDKKERSKNKDKEKAPRDKMIDDEKELRKERKIGRKRDRTEEAIIIAEQKRRKEEEKVAAKLASHQNGDLDEIHHREKHHHSREKSPYGRERERSHDRADKQYPSKQKYYDYDRYYD